MMLRSSLKTEIGGGRNSVLEAKLTFIVMRILRNATAIITC